MELKALQVGDKFKTENSEVVYIKQPLVSGCCKQPKTNVLDVVNNRLTFISDFASVIKIE